VNDVFWINGEQPPHLAVVLRPRGDDWLDDDMRRMRANGVETVISMLEPDEAEFLGLADEQRAAERAGLSFLNYPIPDTQVPEKVDAFRRFVTEIADRLAKGERIGVHCRGSIGRATILSACALIRLGWRPADALSAIEKARGLAVPDTAEQATWILGFKP
jgi:protein-tyrosine phosphatase